MLTPDQIEALNVYQSLDYIHELRLSLLNPGTDFEANDEADAKMYHEQIELTKKSLKEKGYW
jgi:hypothetical protein